MLNRQAQGFPHFFGTKAVAHQVARFDRKLFALIALRLCELRIVVAQREAPEGDVPRFILHHISIDGRQNFDDETVTLDIRDRAATPEEQYGERELNNVLTGAINELRPALKTVVKLCEISEVSNTKTANALGVKVGAIKARTFRARRLLREKIAKRLGARAGKTPSALFSRSRASANSTYQAAFSAVAG